LKREAAEDWGEQLDRVKKKDWTGKARRHASCKERERGATKSNWKESGWTTQGVDRVVGEERALEEDFYVESYRRVDTVLEEGTNTRPPVEKVEEEKARILLFPWGTTQREGLGENGRGVLTSKTGPAGMHHIGGSKSIRRCSQHG